MGRESRQAVLLRLLNDAQKVPLHAACLTEWRQRVGADQLTVLQEETIAIAVQDKLVTTKELAQVTVDTTVQEKPPSWLVGASAPLKS